MIDWAGVAAFASAGAPQVIDKPVQVRVPAAVPCKMAEIREPDRPLAKVPKPASDFEFFRAALVALILRAGYEIRLPGGTGSMPIEKSRPWQGRRHNVRTGNAEGLHSGLGW